MTTAAFDSPPVIIGHRGAAGLVPENTLPSFARAVELGVDAVELDIHLCEETLVVIHDPTLDRTTNGIGGVADMPLELLRQIDAGRGARIPLLCEVFSELPASIGINIELKGAGTARPLAEWLPPPGERPVLLSSFNHASLRAFLAIRTDYPLAPLFDRWKNHVLDTAVEFGSGFVHLGRRAVTAARLKRLRAAGLRPMIYTVNSLAEARKLFDRGAWGVFTDYPDRISRTTL